ncbi:hypothetical protein [Streptomyces sannanensis]|uniref:hypothetical protein n=1 Tax=Streptomyces sannanensis TaxID=285536 RepID=UPI0031EDFEC7
MSSTEQTPAPRPARLTAAAAFVALEGLALVAGGVYMLVMGVVGSPESSQQAETGGLTLIVLALLPLLAARGLLHRRRWSRGPAFVTQIMALPVAWTLLRSQGGFIPAGIALAGVAVTALVMLFHPTTTDALGLRPGARDA